MIQFNPNLKLNEIGLRKNGIIVASEKNVENFSIEDKENFCNALNLAQKEYFMLLDKGIPKKDAKALVRAKYVVNFNRNIKYPILRAKLKEMPTIITEETKEKLFNFINF